MRRSSGRSNARSGVQFTHRAGRVATATLCAGACLGLGVAGASAAQVKRSDEAAGKGRAAAAATKRQEARTAVTRSTTVATTKAKETRPEKATTGPHIVGGTVAAAGAY